MESHVSLTSAELFVHRKLSTCRMVVPGTEYHSVEKRALFTALLLLQ